MRKNALRTAFGSGKPTLGTRAMLADPTIIEVIGRSGLFDYVEFLAEYTAFHLPALDTIVRAADVTGLATMIKVDYELRRYVAQRGVASGFDGVLFADMRTSEDVKYSVASVKPDSPTFSGAYGARPRPVRRGYGEVKGYGNAGSAEYVDEIAATLVGIMVEKPEIVENLEQVLEVGGVDFVQWGPTDFAMSSGLRKQQDVEQMEAVEQRILKVCGKTGIPARIELARVSDLKRYADQGVRHFSVGQDINLFSAALDAVGEGAREALSEYE